MDLDDLCIYACLALWAFVMLYLVALSIWRPWS